MSHIGRYAELGYLSVNVENLCSRRCASAVGISRCSQTVLPGVVILLTAAKSDKSQYAAENIGNFFCILIRYKLSLIGFLDNLNCINM